MIMIRKQIRFMIYCITLAIVASLTLGMVACESKTESKLTLTSITVTPNSSVSLAVGATTYFYATGIYSDRSTADITSNVTWTSSDSNIVTIDWMALATGLAAGTANITATLDGITSTPVTVVVTGTASTTTSP